MARGTVVGEPVVSQAQTKAFDEGYERTFSKDRGERGRFVYDERQKKLVRAEDYVPPSRAIDAPIMAGRFYEGSFVPGSEEDIGSRRKHREFLKRTGWVPASDCAPDWFDRKRAAMKREANKRRHETLERISYQKWKP